MKKLIFAAAFLVFANVSNAQENTLSFNLKGKVRFVEEASFKYVEKFGEIEVGESLGKECKVFNDRGFLIKKYALLGRDTTDVLSYEIVYNEKGQIREVNEYKQYTSRSEKELESKTKFKYDENGKLAQQIIYNGDGSFEKGYKFSNADNGKTIQQQIDSEGNSVEESEENVYVEPDYDDNGQEITGETTYKDVLDAQGNWIKRIEFRGKKQVKGYERRIVYFN
jgi:hypothetical protein